MCFRALSSYGEVLVERVGIPCARTSNGKFFGRGVGFCRGIGLRKTCHGVPEYLIVAA